MKLLHLSKRLRKKKTPKKKFLFIELGENCNNTTFWLCSNHYRSENAKKF